MEIKAKQNGIDIEDSLINKENIKKDKREKYNGSVWLEKRTFRLALVSTFSALAVVLGYALAAIPNIELFTFMIFLGGFILGKRDGLIIGLLSSLIFVFFNPYGASPAPLFIYQIIHYCLTGFIGGVIKGYLHKKEYFKPKEELYSIRIMFYLGLIGALITFIYDVISTLIGALIVSFSMEFFIVSYIYGIPFTTIHLIGNTMEFIFILPGLANLVYKLLD